MEALTRSYDPADGPILNVNISPSWEAAWATFPLLLDTGADGSSISQSVVERLALFSIGRRDTVASAGKQGTMKTFLVDISIDFDTGPWIQREIVVAEFLYLKPSIMGLVGRDILCQGNFIMKADHTFRLEL